MIRTRWVLRLDRVDIFGENDSESARKGKLARETAGNE